MKLLIRNLDRKTTEEELKNLFVEFGSVESCDLVIDRASGESKGFGFVVMARPADAVASMKRLNNQLVGKNRIRVKKAEEKKG